MYKRQVYRYTVRFNEEEHNRFLAMFGKSGVYARSVFLKAHFRIEPYIAGFRLTEFTAVRLCNQRACQGKYLTAIGTEMCIRDRC